MSEHTETWRGLLDKSRPWRERSAIVEAVARKHLAALDPGAVLTTRELVDALFPVPPDGLSAEDTAARYELVQRLLKIAANVPGIARVYHDTPPRGPNKGRTVKRYLWSRVEPRTNSGPALAPGGDPFAEILARLEVIEARLADLAQRVEEE